MARTKRTAQRSTGGKAVRKSDTKPKKSSSSSSSLSSPKTSSISASSSASSSSSLSSPKTSPPKSIADQLYEKFGHKDYLFLIAYLSDIYDMGKKKDSYENKIKYKDEMFKRILNLIDQGGKPSDILTKWKNKYKKLKNKKQNKEKVSTTLTTPLLINSPTPTVPLKEKTDTSSSTTTGYVAHTQRPRNRPKDTNVTRKAPTTTTALSSTGKPSGTKEGKRKAKEITTGSIKLPKESGAKDKSPTDKQSNERPKQTSSKKKTSGTSKFSKIKKTVAQEKRLKRH